MLLLLPKANSTIDITADIDPDIMAFLQMLTKLKKKQPGFVMQLKMNVEEYMLNQYDFKIKMPCETKFKIHNH